METDISVVRSGPLSGLQMLRGFAAAAVVLHHALEESNGAATAFSPDFLTSFGASGVDIFFVISGFIILYTSFPAGRRPLAPASFLLRRIARIYPMYWICCLCIFGVMALGFLQNLNLKPEDIVLSLALLPSSKLIMVISWTLVYEVYFYLVFALTLTSRSALISAIATTAAMMLLMLGASALDDGVLKIFLSNPIVCEFVLGLWLAIGFMRMKVLPPFQPLVVFGAIALLLAAPVYVAAKDTGGLEGWPRLIAWGLPSFVLVGAFLSLSEPRNAWQRSLVYLGDASYSLYLTHIFVMLGYSFFLRKTALAVVPQIIVVPIIILIALIVGVVAHSAVEKPILQGTRRWTRRDRLPQPTAKAPGDLVGN